MRTSKMIGGSKPGVAAPVPVIYFSCLAAYVVGVSCNKDLIDLQVWAVRMSDIPDRCAEFAAAFADGKGYLVVGAHKAL